MNIELLGMMPCCDVNHGFVQPTIAGNDTGGCHWQRIAVCVGNLPSRFFDKQRTASKIPGRQLVLKVAAELTAADLTQIKCRTAEAANSMNFVPKKLFDRRQCLAHHRAAVVVESASD